MRRFLRIAGALAGAVLLIGVAAAVAVPHLVDLHAYEGELSAAVHARTGRHLRVEGEARLTLLPWPGVDARRVVLGNPPEFPQSAFARAERIRIRLQLLPLLLEGRLVTRRVRIGGLHLGLRRNAAGAVNWSGLLAARGGAGEDRGVVPGLLSGHLEVSEASAHLQDSVTGREYRIINLHLESGPVGASPSPVTLAFDMRAGALAGHISASAGLVRAAADVYRLRDATVHAALEGSGGARPTRFTLSTEAELDAAAGILELGELRLEVPEVRIVGVRAEATARARGALRLERGSLQLDGMELSANLFGPRIPGGATEMTARGGFDLDLRRGTVQGRDLRLRLPALIGRGIAGNATVHAEVAGDLARGTFSMDPLSVAVELGGARVPGGVLSVRADARLEGELRTPRLSATALHVAGAGLDARGALSVIGPWGDPHVDGTLRIAPFAPRMILGRFGGGVEIDTPDPHALSEAALVTEISGAGTALRLSPLLLRVDGSEIRGSVALSHRDEPAVRFELASEDVDLDRYLPVRVRRSGPADAGTATTAEAGAHLVGALRALSVAGRLRIGTARLAGAVMQDVEIEVGESARDVALPVLMGMSAPRGAPHP